MPRGSDKHATRIDDSIEHDVRPVTQGNPAEARADEGRHQEGAGDDEPTTDTLLSGDVAPGGDDVLSHDEVEERARLAAALKPSAWPADRAALVASARDGHAPASLIDRLSQLPDGTYTHTEAVWEAMGGRVEHRG